MSTDDDEILQVEQIAKALFRLTLTRSNRADILRYGASRLENNREEAELLLGNLQRWVPGEIAGLFARRSAAAVLEDTPFRLICSSEGGVPLDSGFCIRQYLAVSYCWHDDRPDTKWPPKPPRPEDEVVQPWPIYGRFAEALLKECGHPREGIWMDQLCINQDDQAEKQRAIAAMDIVYKSCRKLVVLLEDVELSEDELRLFESSKYDPQSGKYSGGVRDSANLDEKDLPACFSFSETVERARWWQRAWCFHEFIVIEPGSYKRHFANHKTVFIMGSPGGGTVSIPFMVVQTILALAAQHNPYKHRVFPATTPHLVGLDNQVAPYRDEFRKAGSMRASISGKYNAVASTGCTIATDRLPVMINLSGLSITYVGPAATKEEVYFFGVALALAAGEESPLSYLGSEAVVVHGRPSWVSWSGPPEDLPPPPGDSDLPIRGELTLPKFTLKTLPGIHRISIYELELDMIFFDSVPHVATEEEIRATNDIFPDRIIRSTVPSRMVGMTPERLQHLDEKLNPQRRAFLALAMGLQPSCMGRLWTAIYRDIVKVKFYKGTYDALEPNQDLLPQAKAFLSHISSLNNNNNGETNEEEQIGRQTFDLEAATFFLTLLTDPRTFNYLGLLPFRLQCAVSGAQALTSNMTFNSHFSSSDVRELRGAMPTALVGSSCLPLRMWLLKPVIQRTSNDGGGVDGDDDATAESPRWRVVGKVMILGEPDLNAELEAHRDGGGGGGGGGGGVLTLKRNQVIVG